MITLQTENVNFLFGARQAKFEGFLHGNNLQNRGYKLAMKK